jgi:hypothetical protein
MPTKSRARDSSAKAATAVAPDASNGPQVDASTGKRYYHMRDGSWLECDPIANQVGMYCHEVDQTEVPASVKAAYGLT